jgi:hypothetical protein
MRTLGASSFLDASQGLAAERAANELHVVATFLCVFLVATEAKIGSN